MLIASFAVEYGTRNQAEERYSYAWVQYATIAKSKMMTIISGLIVNYSSHDEIQMQIQYGRNANSFSSGVFGKNLNDLSA